MNGIGDVADLRPGRSGIADHRVKHLSRCNARLANLVAFFDQGLLHVRHFLDRDFNAQVTSGDHDAVRDFQDLVEVADPLAVFDFGDDVDLIPVVFF